MTLLVHLEDPGAVRYIAPLLDRLAHDCVAYKLFASGVANEMLGNLSPYSAATFDDVAADLARSSKVLVGTSENTRTIAFDIIHAAQEASIPVIGAVDAFVNAQHRFAGDTNDPLAHAPDWLMVPNERTARAFAELGLLRERIFVVGHPALDGLECMDRRKLPNACKRVVFVSEVSTGLDPDQYRKSGAYTLQGRGGSALRTTIVVEELLDTINTLRKGGWEIELTLRLHPKETRDDLGPLVHEFDTISSGGDPLGLLQSADLVVGMTSMLLSEAHAMGLPCLSILPREEECQWLEETADGSILTVVQRGDIAPAIESLVANHLAGSGIGDRKGSAISRMLEALSAMTGGDTQIVGAC